jgi:putative SOS response-associated peptidase YedK
VDRLLFRGCGACREIPHEIWRRTIQSKGPRPWIELGAVVQGRTLRIYIAEMCGRFTRNYTWEQIQALYRLTAPAAIPNLQPRFNACPTDPADTIVAHEAERELVEMRWGLVPFWWNKPLKELRLATFNARVETVTTKPFFREPFKNKRCLMPVSGYYEWQGTPEGKQPWYFTARDGSPVLTIAGLWDEWKNRETGERLKSCAMIITEPNEFVAEVHDRMPVLGGFQADQ